jgi:L-aspartate oxidase
MPSTDFLIIGSGIAGLTFALKVADHGRVVIVTKKDDTESNTNYAQGGIAAVFGQDDSSSSHVKDTIEAGAGLSHPEAVEAMVSEGPALVEKLSRLGVAFTQARAGGLDLGREGGHSKRRIVHAKDYTGQEIERALVHQIRSHHNITILEHHLAIDLIIVKNQDEEACCGAYVLEPETGKILEYAAGVTLLAAGGCGQVYLHTTNPAIATGDGIAMAYRSGAAIANMEFMQFHPTTLYQDSLDENERSFLISEAVRGEGAVLRDLKGRAFMPEYNRSADLAPRDVVARAIDSELKASGDFHVNLDISSIGIERFRDRFPNISLGCDQRGINLSNNLIPVVPAAHYICGGVKTDLGGRTSIKGLYAAGETAFTGVHGANRLASNSLLEALVFADRAASAAIGEKSEVQTVPAWDYVGSVPSREKVVIRQNRLSIRWLLWNYAGIVRSDKRLLWARTRLQSIMDEIHDYYWKYQVSEDLVELRNIAAVAKMIIDCAILRKESRGLHYNQDHPDRDDVNYGKDTLINSKGMEMTSKGNS